MDVITNTKPSKTISITFGDVSENHYGNQKNGTLAKHGYSIQDLEFLKNKFEKKQIECELIRLDEVVGKDLGAGILIIKNGLKYFDIHHNELFNELVNLNWDKKFLCPRRKKVFNKKARYNLCFSNENQEPDYESGKGRIYNFDDLPTLNKVRNQLNEFGDEFKKLEVEGNYYYSKKCYIGYHGDAERKKVFALRLGASMNLKYQWYQYSKKVKDEFNFVFNSGDMYVMSQKTSGNDWKKRNILTLRHSADFDKL